MKLSVLSIYCKYMILLAAFHSIDTPVARAQDSTLKGFSPFPVGAAINMNKLKNNASYRALVAREYNSLTAENSMKMLYLHPQPATYYWNDGDTLVAFAQQHGMRVHGHTLVWHNSLPTWVNSFVGDSTRWDSLLHAHINTIVTHYKGKLASWDVVNEAVLDNGQLRNSIWLQKLGPQYIARSFQYAHEADSTALLFYNDYGHEYSDAKLATIDSLVRALKNAGVPIHGVGLQLHVHMNSNNRKIENAIITMKETGLLVHIAELDIRLNPDLDPAATYDTTRAHRQMAGYKFFGRIAQNVPASQFFGITTWGVSDGESYAYSNPDWPLPFHTSYSKKRAFQGLKDGITSSWNFDSASCTSMAGTYTDLGANGTAITTNFTGGAMTYDNDNSSVQSIGFSFAYNGSMYDKFVLNTNGYIKLGAAPSSAHFYYPSATGFTGSVITASDIDLLYPYNHDLMGTGNSEYRIYTSGTAGSRVCVIQFKNVKDKLAPVQYATMNFQVRLYETTNVIEFVYGSWTASLNAASLVTGAVGIKGINPSESVNVAKGSSVAWNTSMSSANNYFFSKGDYPAAGPQFNTRNNALPAAGRIFRFAPNTITLGSSGDAFVRDGSYAAVNYGTDTILTVKKDPTAGFSRMAYIKLNLPQQVRSAAADVKLRLYIVNANSGANTTQWQLWRVNNNSWTETGITYSNRPAPDTLLAMINGSNSAGYQYWDITSTVQQLTGNTLSLAIVSASTGSETNVNFSSEESAVAARRPAIVISSVPEEEMLLATVDPAIRNHLTITGEDKQKKHEWMIYPNPARHYITIKFTGPANMAGGLVKVFTANGTLVHRQTLTSSATTVETGNWPAGTYYAEVGQGGKAAVKTILIVK